MQDGATGAVGLPQGESAANAEMLLRSQTFQQRLEAARLQREHVLSVTKDEILPAPPKPWERSDKPTVQPANSFASPRILKRVTTPAELVLLAPAAPASQIRGMALPTAPDAPPPARDPAQARARSAALAGRVALGFGFGAGAAFVWAWLVALPTGQTPADIAQRAEAPLMAATTAALGDGAPESLTVASPTRPAGEDLSVIAPPPDRLVRLAFPPAPATDPATAPERAALARPLLPLPSVLLWQVAAIPPLPVIATAPMPGDANRVALAVPPAVDPQPFVDVSTPPAPAASRVAVVATPRKKTTQVTPAVAPKADADAAEAAALKSRLLLLLQGTNP